MNLIPFLSVKRLPFEIIVVRMELDVRAFSNFFHKAFFVKSALMSTVNNVVTCLLDSDNVKNICSELLINWPALTHHFSAAYNPRLYKQKSPKLNNSSLRVIKNPKTNSTPISSNCCFLNTNCPFVKYISIVAAQSWKLSIHDHCLVLCDMWFDERWKGQWSKTSGQNTYGK